MIEKLLLRLIALEQAFKRLSTMDTVVKSRLEEVVPVSGELTIHSGFVLINGSGTIDSIAAMNDGFIVTLMRTGSSVTIDTGGNLHLASSFTLDSDYDTITLRYVKALTVWVEIARSNNS